MSNRRPKNRFEMMRSLESEWKEESRGAIALDWLTHIYAGRDLQAAWRKTTDRYQQELIRSFIRERDLRAFDQTDLEQGLLNGEGPFWALFSRHVMARFDAAWPDADISQCRVVGLPKHIGYQRDVVTVVNTGGKIVYSAEVSATVPAARLTIALDDQQKRFFNVDDFVAPSESGVVTHLLDAIW